MGPRIGRQVLLGGLIVILGFTARHIASDTASGLLVLLTLAAAGTSLASLRIGPALAAFAGSVAVLHAAILLGGGAKGDGYLATGAYAFAALLVVVTSGIELHRQRGADA